MTDPAEERARFEIEAARSFAEDLEKWSLPLARKFLDPFYAKAGREFYRYPGDHPIQRRHVDVTVRRVLLVLQRVKRIEEKLLARRDDGKPAEFITAEEMSCTLPRYERRGWVHRHEPCDTTDYLFGFANAKRKDGWEAVTKLDCLWVPFAFRAWYWQHPDRLQWKEHWGKQRNRSFSRLVPISLVELEIKGCRRFTLPED